MELRNLGNSDLKVTPIAFGAWAIGGWMWGGAEKEDALKALKKSYEIGITTVDTAPVYGFGQSEELVGQSIKGIRDKVQVLTKYGMQWKGTKGEYYFSTKNNQGKDIDIYKYSGKESVIKECEESLKRLGTDYIDLYQIHWHDSTTPVEETMEAINKLLEQGKIRAAGVCNYDKDLLIKATEAAPVCSDQVPYSMVNRKIEDELRPWCVENNTSILAYSPLQRGLLTGKFSPGHQFNEGDGRPFSPYFSDENIKRTNHFLSEIRPLAEEKNASLAQLVLRWTLTRPGISCVLAGARNPQQIEDNAAALDIDLSKDDIDFINTKLDNLILDL